MASTVQLKRSAIPGTPPTIAQLNLGELAINTYDGKLYLKKNVTGTESIVEVGGGDMVKATYDTNNDGIVDEAASVPWAGITDVPTVFPPDAHTQEISTINGLQTALDGKQPTGSYTTLTEVSSVTGDMIGFIDRTSTTLSFVEATRTFTITPTGATWSVYNLGSLITVTGARSIVIPNTTGSHFVKLNPTTLELESYIGVPQFATDIIMAYIYWNATTSKAVIVGDERHTSKRDTTWHSNQHLNVGTVWRSGGAASTNLNAGQYRLNIATPILIADEDLLHTITHAASPDGVSYQQVLNSQASLEVIYLSDTDYTTTTASTHPWIMGTTTASYNPIVTSSGTLADAGEGNFITYWVLATNDMRSPVKLVLGRQAHATLDAAYGESFVEYGMSFAEQVFMYQVVVQTSAAYTDVSKIQIRSIRKLQDRMSSASSSYSAGGHGELTGRDAASQHPISAITNLQTTLDGKQATLVSATNIKTINGNTILGSGDLVITGGSGSPGGTSGEVQYNDGAGGFAGALNVEIENGYLRLPDTGSEPGAPAANGLNLFSRNRGGRMLPAWIGPSGLDTNTQPALFGNTIFMWLPGTGTTLAINFATSFTARNSGTSAAQATPTKASTNAMTSLNRATFGTGTTATGASGVQSSATVAWRGNAAGLGGFFFQARFGIETLASDMRAFVGLSANNAAMAADANTWNNTIGIEKGTADSVWYVVQRGTVNTRLSSGATVTAGQVLDMWLYAPPNGSTITVRLANAVTGTVYIDNVILNATLPAATTFMYMQAHCQSVTGTTAKLLALNKMYLESDL